MKLNIGKNNRLTASASFANLEMAQGRYPVELLVRERLARQLAEHLANTRLERVENAHSIDFRMDVYVLTSDELFGLIEQRAREIGLCMPPGGLTDG